jgi:hypothetical protein
MGSIIMSVSIVAVGVAFGLLRGGSIDGLLEARPRWWGLLASGFVLHATAEAADIPGAISLSIAGMFLLIIALMANAAIRGALVAALGVSLNLLVLVINGAVPARFEALVEAGIVDQGIARSRVTSVGHLLELESADSRLADLGDVIPIGVLSSVISIGDLITFSGVILIVSGLIAAKPRNRVHIDVLLGPAALYPDEHAAEAERAWLGDLDFVSDLAAPIELETAPLIDITEPIELDEEATVDLTAYDPDELWASDPAEGVRILGPTTNRQ